MANKYILVKNIKVPKNHETYFIPYIRLFRYHPNIINCIDAVCCTEYRRILYKEFIVTKQFTATKYIKRIYCKNPL